MRVERRKPKPRKTPWVVGTLMVASLALLVILQSTNLWKEFTIESSSDLILLYALSSLNFIAFVIFAFIFLRSIIKLVRERRTFELGAKIKTRLLIYFFAVSLLPIIAMAVFSYLFMNRALERWFTQIPVNVIRQTRDLQKESIAERSAKLDETAKMVATLLDKELVHSIDLEQIASAGNLSYIEVNGPGSPAVSFTKPLIETKRAELESLLAIAHSEGPNAPGLRDGRGFDIAIADMSAGRRLIMVPDPYSEEGVAQIADQSMAEFERLKQKQVTVRQVGLLTLGMLTFLLIFASSWIAFYVARGLTTPIKALAEGANEIAGGRLGYRVEVLAEDELALLVSAFNDMSAKLETNAVELSEGRRYIEAVLDTLPTGVVSFDGNNRIRRINRAARTILRIGEMDDVSSIETLVDDKNRTLIERLVDRARRVGHASDQATLEAIGKNGSASTDIELTVALTAAKLPDTNGVVLVVEDLSELIAAQRASAWQEVARRMAHEIKNPLTPIQLSAERIAKRFADAGPLSDTPVLGEVVEESTATILREVTSLKSMVNEFSRFARLPEVKLIPGDLNEVVNEAVAAFDGHKKVSVQQQLDGTLPEISLDHEQLKRVFVNLIKNSAEAANGTVGNVIIRTRHDSARGLVVAEVSDDGAGIRPGDLQKLFQPYFSTKGRGTGLGLAIVGRIISEHRGRIHAVVNRPRGAKFIIELPVS